MEYKGYLIEKEPDYLMTVINAVGRGSVHKSLRGFYSTFKDAEKAIDYYENEKEVANDEIVQRSGSKQVQRRTYHRRKPINDH